jgi:hypothetical protein
VTSTTPPDTSPIETVAVEPAPSESDTPWGWIVLAVGLLAAAITGVVIWRRKQRGAPPA